MDTTSIAERLTREVRTSMSAKGISQRKLAEMTGIPINTLNQRLKRGTTRPFTLGELALVLDALDLSLIDLAVKAERIPAAA